MDPTDSKFRSSEPVFRRMPSWSRTRLAPLVVASLVVISAPAETIVLTPAADTTLFETTPTNNLGRVSSLAAGTTARSRRARALLRFELGSLPAHAEITDASLTLTVVRAPAGGGGVDSTFALHRMRVSWIEGTKSTEANGAPATPGEPTWQARSHPSTPWTLPGAGDPADHESEASALQWIGSAGEFEFAGLAPDVDRWRSGAATNHGWLLMSQDEANSTTARRFGAREDASAPPRLRIEFFRRDPPAARLFGAQRIPGSLQFQFEAQPNVAYAVERRTNLSFGAWGVVTNIAAAATLRFVVVSDRPAADTGFYRVTAVMW